MKRLLEVCLVVLSLAATPNPLASKPSSMPPAANSLFAGMWRGEVNHLPAIQLEVNEVGGKLGGEIVFDMQSRIDDGSPWRVTGEYRAPLRRPHVESGALLFEVEHHVCHDCPELGPNAQFRMELASPDEARLWNLSEPTGANPWMILNRQGTPAAGAEPQARPALPLQKGISVQMPVTSSATPMPDADKEGARIVAVTSEGVVFLGTQSTAAGIRKEEVEKWLGSSADKKVYIKADARTPFQNVIGVLDALQELGVKEVVFLTRQKETPAVGRPVSPSGLEVLINPTGRER
jgi:biopolymer transport protein ExbD